MDENTMTLKARGRLGLLIACVMTGVSIFVALPHTRTGSIDPVEAMLIGPAAAGFMLGVFIAAGVGAEMDLVLVCTLCTSVIGWYSLFVCIFMPGRYPLTRQKLFWGLVLFLTWAPAVFIAIAIATGIHVGSSM